jgi:hypothetical protein
MEHINTLCGQNAMFLNGKKWVVDIQLPLSCKGLNTRDACSALNWAAVTAAQDRKEKQEMTHFSAHSECGHVEPLRQSVRCLLRRAFTTGPTPPKFNAACTEVHHGTRF